MKRNDSLKFNASFMHAVAGAAICLAVAMVSLMYWGNAGIGGSGGALLFMAAVIAIIAGMLNLVLALDEVAAKQNERRSVLNMEEGRAASLKKVS